MSENINTGETTLVDHGWLIPEPVNPVVDLTTTTTTEASGNNGVRFGLDPNTIVSELEFNSNFSAIMCWYQPWPYVAIVIALIVGIAIGILIGACIWRCRKVTGETTRSDSNHNQEMHHLNPQQFPINIVTHNYPTSPT